MAIGDPPGNVYTQHADGSITSQPGWLTDEMQYIDEIPISGSDQSNRSSAYDNDYGLITDSGDGNWFPSNSQWLLPVLGAVASIGTGTWIPALIGGLFGLWSNSQQNKYNQENYEIQKKDALEAEQRANDEYDRRQQDARQYNDAWADRLRSQGFNPLAVLSKGGGVTATTASSPSTTSMPLRQPRSSGLGSISQSMSQMMNILSTTSALKQQQATTENIQANTELTEAETESKKQLNESFWERFSKEMQLLGANLRNQNAVADINESLARVRLATEQDDIQQVKYATVSLYYDMKAAQYAPQIANQQLANLCLEYSINTLRKRVAANEASASDMSLADLKAHYESRAAHNAADREVLAAINAAESAASKLAKEDTFLPIDKIFGYTESIVGMMHNHMGATSKLIDAVIPL